jgi:VanZ family protein
LFRNKLIGLAALGYVAFLLYGSLLPFDFSATAEIVSRHFHDAFGFWPFAHTQHTSKADVVTNLVLYIPAGFLIALWANVSGRKSSVAAFAIGSFACMILSGMVETLQAFSITRVTSAQDWLMNAFGGAAGAATAVTRGRAWFVALARKMRLLWPQRPAAVFAAVLMVLLALDAFFPYRPTLDVSQVAHNFRASRFSFETGLAAHYWHHWLVQRVAAFGLLSCLLACGARRPGWRTALAAVLWTMAFAAAIEAGKIFIESRSANIANVVMSAIGAACGGLSAVKARRLDRRWALACGTAVLMGYLSYLELEPFNFAWDVPQMELKVPAGAQWLPLYDYVARGGIEDVSLFGTTLLLTATAVWLAGQACRQPARWGQWKRIAIGALSMAAMGLLLEGLQFLLPQRVPSISTVFGFLVGGAIGGYLVPLRIGQPSGDLVSSLPARDVAVAEGKRSIQETNVYGG